MRDHLRKVLAVIFLLMLALAAMSLILQRHQAGGIQKELADTRRALREQGFKTDLEDFDFKTDTAMRSRETALTFFGDLVRQTTPAEIVYLLPTVADGSGEVIWKQDWLTGGEGNLTWPELRDSLGEIQLELDAACQAALAGPIAFNLDASRGRSMLLPHLASLKKLEQTLGSRAAEELHDGQPDAAWTNVLALTDLITAWRVEPAEVSQMVRFALVNIGFQATWQALQYGRWPDEKLAALQHEWEAADFLTNLPDTAAFQRASDTAMCRREREEPMAGGVPLAEIIKESMRSPGVAIAAIKESWDTARYRSYGTYDDEKNLLLFHQKRELELRDAIAAPTWAQMRSLPGVTNAPVFTSPYRSRLVSMMTLRATSLHTLNQNSGLLARAAGAEARRRILVTAIALERFHRKHGAYPPTLAKLVPEFLAAAPVDFMDGQPLRYRPDNDAHFTLYSAGLDCVDDGGTAEPPMAGMGPMRGRATGWGKPEPKSDIVWPRPASAADAAAQHEQEMDDARTKAEEVEDIQATAQWEHTARQQAGLNAILAAPAITNVPDLTIQGRPLSETLRNPQVTGSNQLSLVEMLTLKPIITGAEPETVTFELPIAFDVLTNLGGVHLYIDPTTNDESDLGCNVMQMECTRATNGDCLLAWSTIYESPGPHALQAGLTLEELAPDKQNADGPLLPWTVTNLCQFSLGSAHFEPAIGATWHARLPEGNASYVIELSTSDGTRLKTITGNTSTGELKAFWNLVDDHGRRFTGDAFNSVFRLTFPDSGRTQTLRGP